MTPLWMAVVVGFVSLIGATALFIVKSRSAEREHDRVRRSAKDKDSFLAGVGHTLRTPLAAIVGMLDLVVDPTAGLTPSEREEFIETARVEARGLADSIDDFLTAGRLSADVLTVLDGPADLDEVVMECLQRVRIPEEVSLVVGDRFGHCSGDPLRIRQIVHSLLRNAARFADSYIHVFSSIETDLTIIEVRNDGPPVPESLLDQRFDPFAAVTEIGQPQSMGMGLWLAQELAARMGGRLAHRRKGNETVFALSLVHQTSDSVDRLTPDVARPIPKPHKTTRVDSVGQSSPTKRAGLSSSDLVVLKQPIVDLQRGQVAGYEALTRGASDQNNLSWPRLRSLYPHLDLQHAALVACLELKESLPTNTFLAVNVDTPLIAEPPIVDAIKSLGDLHKLVLELTEYDVELDDQTLNVLAELRSDGALLALDDFGAGHNGLDRLVQLRPDFVKLDGRLVERFDQDPASRAVIDSIGDLASRFDAWLVAERVERPAQLQILASYQVPLAQGYLFAHPGPGWPQISPDTLAQLRTVRAHFDVDGSIAALVETPSVDPPTAEDQRRIITDPSNRVIALQDGPNLVTRPLVLSVSDSAETALKRALSRPKDVRYTPLVAIDSAGEPLGIVTIERLARAAKKSRPQDPDTIRR